MTTLESKLNRDATVVVDPDYRWQPMSTCPRGVKVQLLGSGGVATYGQFDGNGHTWWRMWAPLPTMPKT
ncbi:hypothetical protein [Rhodoferax sp.]|uniref:hypothetical protein n=1 Tax=Rhodoferax sp. TaxID=50421 RepID=UPI0027714C83|nr:hypothetical protein [Rhodoferax sp.]